MLLGALAFALARPPLTAGSAARVPMCALLSRLWTAESAVYGWSGALVISTSLSLLGCGRLGRLWTAESVVAVWANSGRLERRWTAKPAVAGG